MQLPWAGSMHLHGLPAHLVLVELAGTLPVINRGRIWTREVGHWEQSTFPWYCSWQWWGLCFCKLKSLPLQSNIPNRFINTSSLDGFSGDPPSWFSVAHFILVKGLWGLRTLSICINPVSYVRPAPNLPKVAPSSRSLVTLLVSLSEFPALTMWTLF